MSKQKCKVRDKRREFIVGCLLCSFVSIYSVAALNKNVHIGTKALLRVLLKLSDEQHNLIKMTTIMTFYHHLGEFIMIPLVIKCFLLVVVAFDLRH